ncbi:MAG: hypothetical protein IBX71_00425 [Candidatus Desulforudis sp.]|nr:hypothetical protein [Desulforudis sp.]
MNRYTLTIVKEANDGVHFNLFVNGGLTNLGGLLYLRKEAFDQLFKDLFRASKGNCIKAFCARHRNRDPNTPPQ